MPVIASRYRLDRVVGRGGMGEVWLAEDTLLARPVAAKRIGARDPSEEDVRRARREAKVAAMLDDDHVVRVFDLVPDAGEQWLVMEYVESVNLAQLVKGNGPLDPTVAARLVHQTAQALAAAHRSGIVHRDVKPSNLLVQSSGHVKLGDFGIARLEGDASVTRTGQLVGSPGYLPPEVASGRSATAASDLWSLGATAWFAVQGRAPYDASDGNVVGALYRIVNDEPPPAPDAGWLGPLLEHLMVKDPAGRWSADQVVTYLGAALAGDRAPQTVGTGVPALTAFTAGADGADVADVADGTDGESTGTIEAPAARTPVDADRAARPPSPARTPRRWWPVAAVLVLVVVLAGAVVVVATRGEDASQRRAGSSPTPSTTSTPTPTVPTSAGMLSFVRSYLQQAPNDPSDAFRRLTPGFQDESGGLQGYEGFWGTIASATPTRIEADTEAGTVTYDVSYTMDDGGKDTDTVTLALQLRDGRYLISGER